METIYASNETVIQSDIRDWMEYQQVQGILDAELEEQALLAWINSLYYEGYEDEPCDGSQACYNALTNDPQEWK